MPEIVLRHEIATDEDTYFDKCLFDPEYARTLYVDELKFAGFEHLETKDEGGKLTRKVRSTPPSEALPGPVKKLVGDKLAYVEEGVYDRASKRYTFKITPSAMADKTKIDGEIWCEKAGDKKIVRCARIKVEVKVFGIGGMVENKMLGDIKTSYERAATFTNDWVREKGL